MAGCNGCLARLTAAMTGCWRKYDASIVKSLARPKMTVAVIMGVFVLSLALSPLLGVSFFPRTDPGQFVINVKAPERHPPRTHQ